MLLVLSITIVCGLILSIIGNFAPAEASEYIGDIFGLVLSTFIICFAVLLLVGVVLGVAALVYWLFLVQPSVLVRFIICFLAVALVGYAVSVFIQTPYYVMLCEKYEQLIKMLTQS